MNNYNLIQHAFGHDYPQMMDDLKWIKDNNDDADIRLCVDIENGHPSWIIRYGDASFDQKHSMYCACSFLDESTDLALVLEDLINQINDQVIMVEL